ncbi:MAG: ATP-binding cassette domain-containing protein [Deltaproteobacteria bacterium]|jgi:tungstate transport system ATP-binding protein|nr:ATP-binding cassette domain-containing protein [Deltaproteobacteria bacterium]
MTIRELAYHLKDICHYYGNTKVLDIDELKIKKRSITALIGPNGSGKSTLLKLLAFAQKPTQGQILYKGRKEYPFSSGIRSKITLLTQKPYLLKRTIFENIAYGLKIRKDTDNLEKRVKEALLNVGLDYEKFENRKWHELSGGEAQRVAMAARLILKPEVLLLDEPVASVDTKSAKLIRRASLNARQELGTTLVIASHDLQWLYSISDRQISMFKGQLFSTGIENIITQPFEKQNSKTHIKRLDDGQIIKLPPPAPKTCNAIIRKKKVFIGLEQQEESASLNQLYGQIASMLFEKKTGLIMTTVTVHDTSFVLRLNPDEITNLELHPGKKVILKFDIHDIEWI